MKNKNIKIPLGDIDMDTGEFVEGGDPQSKVVISDIDSGSLPNYECDNCDFETMSSKEAEMHMKNTRHEMWKKRITGN